jgi:multiple antibiotic resistance protein
MLVPERQRATLLALTSYVRRPRLPISNCWYFRVTRVLPDTVGATLVECSLGQAVTDVRGDEGDRSIDVFREAIVLTIGALVPIMNPFSTAPLFIALTAGMDRKKRNRQALLACIYAFGILIVFLLLGSAIIEFFRISIPGLRTAGGLIMSTIGFRMLFPASPVVAINPAQAPQQELDIAFTPLAMPSLAGPGSITVVLTAAPQLARVHPDDRGVAYAGVIAGMVLTLIFCLLVLRLAGSMIRFLGQSGIDAMTRIFGFLLICIGMQFLLTGIADFFNIARV